MKTRLPVLLIPLALVLFCPPALCSRVIYVKTTGLDLNDGTSWSRAKKTVQAGLAAAASGDEVWVAAGTYTEIITLKDGVALYGGFAGTENLRDQRIWRTNQTILEGGVTGSVVTAPPGAGASTRIDGFTIRKGKGTARVISGQTYYYGGGVYCRSSSPAIANNIITANTVQHLGGAIYCEEASPAITGNIITANSAGQNGAGIHCQNSSPVIANNMIVRNTVTGTGPTGGQGGGVYCGGSSSPSVANNTVADNAVPADTRGGGGVCCATGSSPTLVNNIISYNSSGIYAASQIALHHNCVSKNTYFDYEGLTEGSSDISSDPLFVDRAAGNYHIQGASPCMNRGDNSVLQSGWTDVDGQGRVYATQVDMGADEFWPPTVTITYPTSEAAYSTGNSELGLAGTASEGVTTVSWQNDRGGGGYCIGTTTWSASGIMLKAGANVITVTARDDAGYASTDILSVTYNSGALANVVYVRTDGSDSNDGSSWLLAKRTIQAGINEAISGEEVWVAAGAYRENITLKDGVAVYGGFKGTEGARDERRFAKNATIIDGGGSGGGNVVKAASDTTDNTRIDGFTIRNGGASNSGGVYCYNSRVTIANCVIRNNSAVQGHGGGVHISGGAVTLTGNLIFGNSASNGHGGGVYCWTCGGGTTIVNNTIADNTSSLGGGVHTYNCVSQMNIANNIIAFNSSGVHCNGSVPRLSYNNVYGNTNYDYSGGASAGTGGMSRDPEFADHVGGNYHLTSNSPCIDNGWTLAPGLTTYDTDGQGRIRGAVDMGADEFWPTAAVSITSPTSDPTYLTSSSVVSIGGTASEGVLAVSWSSDRGSSGVCAGTTAWSANIPLGIGANNITVTADAVESAAQDVLTVYYDAAAPTVRITAPTSDPSYSTGVAVLSIGGTASDDTGVTAVAWANSRGGAGACVGTAAWSASGIALLPGMNLITVTATDAAGKSASAQLSVTFTDATPPAVTITSPTSGASYSTKAAKVTLSGTASDDVGVQNVTWTNDRGGSGTCAGTTSWSAADVSLVAGANVITITATDTSGNTATDVLTVTCDPVPPAIAITSPTTDATYATTTAKLDLAGTASDDIGVTAVSWSNDRGGSGACTGTADWSARLIQLYPGENNITVTARDAAGNAATDALKVTFTDTTAPTVNITRPTSEPTYSTNSVSIDISGTALDDAALASVRWSNDRGGSGTCTGVHSWSAAGVPLAVGDNVVTISAVDTSGNTGTDTIVVTFTDTAAPAVTITSPTSGDTWGRTCQSMTIGGTASDEAGLASITWSNDRGGSGTCTGTTTWSAADIRLELGQNVITVTASDTSGNTSTDTLTVTCDTSVLPGSAWSGLAMVSVPMVPDSTDPRPVVGFAANYWVSYRPDSGYTQYPDRRTWFEPTSAAPGRGFWAYFDSAPAGPCGGIPAQNAPFSVLLAEGWNLVGNPFILGVEWNVDRLMVREAGGAERPLRSAEDSVASYAWGWDPAARQYYLISDTSTIPGVRNRLEPWQAYWIKAYRDCELVIPAP